MNKKIIFIFILTVIALAILTFYAFGPSSAIHINPQPNPVSLQSTTAQTTVGQKNLALSVYHNKDLAENFYSVSVPQSWGVQASTQAGEYDFAFDGGTAKIGLQDVSDNTTLELFVLSQEEPSLKKSTAGYKRLDYQKITVNGNNAYQLIYTSNTNGINYETIKTYITGQDHAGVITFSAPQNSIITLKSVFDLVINGFRWENK